MSKRATGALCILGLAVARPARSEEPFRDALSEQKRIWTSPFHIERDQIPWLVAFGAGTVGLIALDKHITHNLPDSPSQLRWGTNVSRAGSIYGLMGLSGLMYVAGKASHKDRLKTTGLASAEAAMHSFVVTYGLKLAFGRERPGTGSGDGQFWKAYDVAWKGNASFPSGHSMGAWSVASVVAHEYDDTKWVPVVAYGLASSVSVARVAARKHHASDVVAGGALGYLLGRMVSRGYDAKRSSPLRPRVVPAVDIANRSAGLGLVWAWR